MKKALLCILLSCVLLLGGCTPIYKQPSYVIISSFNTMVQCNSLSLWHYSLQAAGDGLLWIAPTDKTINTDAMVQLAEGYLNMLEELKLYTEDIIDRSLLDRDLKNLGADNPNRIDEMLESYTELSARLNEAFRTIMENGEKTDFETFSSLLSQYEKKLKNNKDICNEFYELAVCRLNGMNTKGLDEGIIEQCRCYTALSSSLYQQQQLVQEISCCLTDLYSAFLDTVKKELNPAGYYQRYRDQITGLTAEFNAALQQTEKIKQLANTLSVDVSEYDQLLTALQQTLLQMNQINENFGAYINSKDLDLLAQSIDMIETATSELFRIYSELYYYHIDTAAPMTELAF